MYRFAAIYATNQSTRTQEQFYSINEKLKEHFVNARSIATSKDLVIIDVPDSRSRMDYHTLDGQRGVILGQCFYPKPTGEREINSERASKVFSRAQTDKIIDTRGDVLGEEYWGAYVGIFRSKNNDCLYVIRAPQGRLGCFLYELNGVFILFSDPSLLDFLGRKNFSIDWDKLPIHLRRTPFVHHDTTIVGVTAVSTSQRAQITSKGVSIEYFWDPLKICSLPAIDSHEDAKNAMRQVTFDTFRTLSKIYPRSGVTLSGGFDSSLLLGVLSQFTDSRNILGLTFYNDSKLVDERDYARLTSQRAGVQLIEYELKGKEINSMEYERLNSIPWPFEASYDLERGKVEYELATEHDIPVFFDGVGGDEVFFSHGENGAAIDYILTNGLTPDIFKVAMRSAWLSNTTIWKTMSLMLKAKYGKPKDWYSDYYNFPDILWGVSDSVKRGRLELQYRKPWEMPGSFPPPGKRGQIYAAMLPSFDFNFIKGVERIEHVLPFLSQPIVEVCLRIPTYLQQYNGLDRALARQTFCDFIATEVRHRRFKSHFSPYVFDKLKQNIGAYVDFLLDGMLAEKGLLNTAELKQIKDDGAGGSDMQYARLSTLVDVEAWVRSWSQ